MPTSKKRLRRDALPPLVVVVAYDQLGLFEFGIATEIFGLPRPEAGPGWYRFAIAAAEPGPLRALGGLRIEVDGGLDLLDAAHTIVIPSWRDTRASAPDALIKALQRAHKRKTRIVSICAGAFVLAQAGLLQGRRATTHWRNADVLASGYPQIAVEPGVLYVDEGDILTSAGSAAGIDLCLHIVRADFGPAIANQVAKRLVMPVHR
ncbi:MAG: transcriptional regulator FtrA, partial [Oxalobacteraceae bacterium]